MNPAPSRAEHAAFNVILATVVLAPLAFWPSPYATLDLIKTIVIAAGTLVSAILLGIAAMKDHQIALPPKPILWTSLLLCLSVVLSAFFSGHLGKAFFGQGFEAGTASFFLILFLAAYASFVAVKREPGRAVVIFVGLTASFLILYVFHVLRLILGPGFASLATLNSVVATVFGGWYGLGAYSLMIALVSVVALLFLPLTRRIKALYWILLAVSGLSAFVINDRRAWAAAALVFLGLTLFASMRRSPRTEASGKAKRFIARIAWIPLAACVVAGLFTLKGAAIATPAIAKLNASYSEIVLPWQLSLDVITGTLKTNPVFGVGPNRFAQAYLDNKPALVNTSDAWNIEFTSGWSTFSTFVVDEGIVGTLLWALFLVFFGIAGVRALRRLPDDPQNAFVVVLSFAASSFLWILMLLAPAQHVLLFYAFVLTGIFVGSAVAAGALPSKEVVPNPRSVLSKMFPSIAAFLILVAILWSLVYVKKTVALAYFASGVKQLTTAAPAGNADLADADFAAAHKWDPSDIYLQARAEASISRADLIGSSVTAQSSASTSQAALARVVSILSDGAGYAKSAIAYDPSNYYNYVSQARVAAAAARLSAPNAYENAVQAYMSAIKLNPENPSLYLSLAQLQASNNKLDDALQTIGAGLRVKNNYLDAVFLLSQIEAAKGDLANAIIAAQVAAQLNPQNPVLFFQLGLLEYENKAYDAAAQAFAQALKLQPDYANAQYFLGLSDARLGRNGDAIAQFQNLALNNPDNQEVAFILSNLKEGKSPFADAQPPITPTPEKRPALPIKQKK